MSLGIVNLKILSIFAPLLVKHRVFIRGVAQSG